MNRAPGQRRLGILLPQAETVGGAETMLLAVAAELAADSAVDLTLYALGQGAVVDELRQAGLAVDCLPSFRLRRPLAWWQAQKELTPLLVRDQPEMLLSWQAKAHLVGQPAARVAGVRASWFQHGFPDGGRIDRLARRLPTAGVFCASRAVRQAMAWPMAVPCPVVYPCLRQEFLAREWVDPAAARRRLAGNDPGLARLHEAALVVGTVARLQPQKGIGVLLEAFRLLAAETPSACLLVVGGPTPEAPGYEERLRRQAAGLGVAERVVFAGAQQQVRPWMETMDLFSLVTSQPEGFGITLLEAMALGRPVLAAATGGPSEFVTREAGVLLENSNPHELARALRELLADAARRRRMGVAGKEVAGRFTARASARSLLQGVEEMIGSAAACG